MLGQQLKLNERKQEEGPKPVTGEIAISKVTEIVKPAEVTDMVRLAEVTKIAITLTNEAESHSATC